MDEYMDGWVLGSVLFGSRVRWSDELTLGLDGWIDGWEEDGFMFSYSVGSW